MIFRRWKLPANNGNFDLFAPLHRVERTLELTLDQAYDLALELTQGGLQQPIVGHGSEPFV
jgi:hypothetical protein